MFLLSHHLIHNAHGVCVTWLHAPCATLTPAQHCLSTKMLTGTNNTREVCTPFCKHQLVWDNPKLCAFYWLQKFWIQSTCIWGPGVKHSEFVTVPQIQVQSEYVVTRSCGVGVQFRTVRCCPTMISCTQDSQYRDNIPSAYQFCNIQWLYDYVVYWSGGICSNFVDSVIWLGVQFADVLCLYKNIKMRIVWIQL